MILFNLVCSSGHSFECWFRDGAACESQIAAGEVICPACGDSLVHKAPMAPHIARGGVRRAETEKAEADGDVPAKALRQALETLRRHVEDNADYVGPRFAEEARRMHYGETGERPIYGEASPEQTSALREEGIEAVAIPWLPRQDS